MTDDPRDARATRDGNANDAPVEPASTPAQTQEPANETASLPAPEVAPVQETPAPAQTPVDASWRAPLVRALEKIRFRKRAKLEKIVALAAKKRSITNDDVQLHVHVSDATATRYLSELVREGKLRRKGIRGGALYEPL